MRTLKFIVDKQIIRQDPECDFTGLVPGTDGYLEADFSFSPEWNGCSKAVSFYTAMGNECPPRLLKDGKTCMIPTEALRGRAFKIKVFGKKQDFAITTDKIVVLQNGGKE